MLSKNTFRLSSLAAVVFLTLASCSKEDAAAPVVPSPPTAAPFDINSINDTYAEVASQANSNKWGSYNVHDPAIIKEGDTYYIYSTDVGFGISDTDLTPGLQVRQSKDLIEWKYVGNVFSGAPALGANFIRSAGGVPNRLLWAPYVLKVGNEFRLYYSLASNTFKLSVIGMATAPSPRGPWTEKGLVVTSSDGGGRATNAIDPTVVVDQQGQHHMYYGSAFDGIYHLRLDAATGLAAANGDKGRRVAERGYTGNRINGNIEAPEIIYNRQQGKYYLFISYDWLFTKYNVRVGRSSSPEGPFLDYNGRDINLAEDHGPMILAPYRFNGHSGWQGTAHCGVLEENGQFYMAHQGRPGVNPFFMDLHVRKIFWTPSGWPVVSPQRYAGEDNSLVPQADILGTWEQITFDNYKVVPGYGDEQTDPDFKNSTPLTLDAAGAGTVWTYTAPYLELKLANGRTAKLFVQKGRDWEKKKPTIIFSGLDDAGIAIWGKKN